MWMSILKKHEVKFSFLQFVAYGTIVSIPTLFAALGGLAITLL
jgi:Na+/H+ antiporter NhaD/arsenite permease-like protein